MVGKTTTRRMTKMMMATGRIGARSSRKKILNLSWVHVTIISEFVEIDVKTNIAY